MIQGSEKSRIESFVQKEDGARRLFKTQAIVNQYYYQGLYHFKASPDGVYIETDTSLARGYVKMPILRNLVDRATATIMGQRSRFIASQTGGLETDYKAALGATLMIDEFDRANSVHINNIHLARLLVLMGKAFKRIYLEKDFVPIEAAPEQLQIYERVKQEMGDPVQMRDVVPSRDGMVRAYVNLPVVREQVMNPLTMLVQTGAHSLGEATEFCCHEVRPISWVKHKFPDFDHERLMHAENISNVYNAHDQGNVGNVRYIAGAGQQGGETFSATAKLVHIYDYYFKNADGTYEHVVFASRKFIPLLRETVDVHPFVEYSSNKMEGYFWDTAITTDIVDQQRTICWFWKQVLENYSSSVKDVIIVPQGMKTRLTTDFNHVIEENVAYASQIRKLNQSSGTHNIAMDIARSIKSEMFDSFGFGDTMRGVTKSHVSATAMNMAMNADSNRLGLIRTEIDNSERLKYKKVLEFSKQVFDEPRVLASSGAESGASIYRAFTSRDLAGVGDIEISETIDLPRDAADRLQLAQELARGGLIESPDEFKDFVKLGTGWLPEHSTDQMERARAETINEWIRTGQAVPSGLMMQDQFADERDQVGNGGISPDQLIYVGKVRENFGKPIIRPTDIHPIHIDVIEKALRSGTFSQQAEQIAMLLLQQRTDIARAEEEAQIARQLEMMARESVASQAGQMAMTTQSAVLDAKPQPAKLTPSQGGQRSGEVRRGEREKQ